MEPDHHSNSSFFSGKPDWPSCTVSADLIPTAATAGVSAVALKGEAKVEAAREPAPSSRACRRDNAWARASWGLAVAVVMMELQLLKQACRDTHA